MQHDLSPLSATWLPQPMNTQKGRWEIDNHNDNIMGAELKSVVGMMWAGNLPISLENNDEIELTVAGAVGGSTTTTGLSGSCNLGAS